MDSLSIVIIVVSLLLAFLFKFVLLKRIREWIDQDLLRSLSSGNPDLLRELNELDTQLRTEGVSRAERHKQLEAKANTLN
jgi:flagellar motor component MotA